MMPTYTVRTGEVTARTATVAQPRAVYFARLAYIIPTITEFA